MFERSVVAGCLFGTAIGDALGAETEFMTMDTIRRQFPPNGPLEPQGNPARVTDDTQMMLAVGEGLIDAPHPFASESLAETLQLHFLTWFHSPDNDRFPGSTCLSACGRLDRGVDWHHAGDISSKGCGANMRVMPVGLLDVDEATRAGIAQLQAALTHAHPTGLAAADLTAFAIAELAGGLAPHRLVERLRDYANSQRKVYHVAWLDDIWKRENFMESADAFIQHGWDECLNVIDNLERALIVGDRDGDPCVAMGEGWIAEEALGAALLCFLLFPDDPVAAVRRGAFSSGDSDSIAAIAGALAGTYHGLDAWPPDWVARIEYRDRIDAMVDWLAG